MRVLLGMILGACLTVGAAFVYDNWSPPATTGTAAEHRTMVNWDVVGENWRQVRRRAVEAWTALSQKIAG